MLEPCGIPEYRDLPEIDLSKDVSYTFRPLIQEYNNWETGVVEFKEAGRVIFIIEGRRALVGPIVDAAFEQLQKLRGNDEGLVQT